MEIKEVNNRLVSGFFSLTFRKFVLLAINFLTINILLARILPVEVIGIFNIATAILSFFTFFSDIGLAAAIIQKKDITENDLKTTFTIQEILALAVTIALWLTAPWLTSWYQLDLAGMWLIRSLAVGFFLTSLKVIPSVLLERYLRFQPLVWVEIVETVVFNVVLVSLVYRGLTIEAFSWATLGRSVIGAAMINIIAPWKIGIGLSKAAAKQLLNFGIPFQLNSLLALLKDRLVPLVIAQIIGKAGVGYITWAQGMAFLPLEVMNIIIRITFPAFSRLQDNPAELKQAIERSLFMTTVLLYPLLFGLMAVMPSLIDHVVSSKWQPSLPLFYLFCLTTFWATLSSPFTNIFNAIGKVGITLKLMIMWTALTWVLSPILAYQYSYLGPALASALISFTSVIPLLIIRKMMKINIIGTITQPLIAAVVMALPTYFLANMLVTDFISLLLVSLLGGSFYLIVIWFLAHNQIKETIRYIVHKEHLDA